MSDTTKNSGKKEIPILESGLGIEDGDFSSLFSACLGKTAANQYACAAQIVRDRPWVIDIRKGVIAFEDSAFPMQVIGNESSGDEAWQWSWDNESIPLPLKRDARRIKTAGKKHGFEMLTLPMMKLGGAVNGHNLSIVSTALLEENVCYYRAPHEKGAMFVFIKGLPASVFAPINIPSFIETASNLINGYDLDHRIFIESFLLQNGCKVTRDGEKLIGAFPDGSLEFSFDGMGRLSSVESE